MSLARFSCRRCVGLIALNLWTLQLLAGELQNTSGEVVPGTPVDSEPVTCRIWLTQAGLTAETENFRIHSSTDNVTLRAIASTCERHRRAVQNQWLQESDRTAWTPKCDVYCYRSGFEYQQATGFPAEASGHADLEIGDGRVWMRAVHLRSDLRERTDRILTHELTHVVLADHFCRYRIPRWADEGIAVLVEPEARRRELQRKLIQALDRGYDGDWNTLASRSQIPPGRDEGDLFYANSVSWIEFLRIRGGLTGTEILEFVSRSHSSGLHAAVSKQFPATTVAMLQQEWRSWLIEKSQDESTSLVTMMKLESSAISAMP